MPADDDKPFEPTNSQDTQGKPENAVIKIDGDGFDGANDEALMIRIQVLQQEHADLDLAIEALASMPAPDSLVVARLKKKKLRLKDEINRLYDQMTPDIIA